MKKKMTLLNIESLCFFVIFYQMSTWNTPSSLSSSYTWLWRVFCCCCFEDIISLLEQYLIITWGSLKNEWKGRKRKTSAQASTRKVKTNLWAWSPNPVLGPLILSLRCPWVAGVFDVLGLSVGLQDAERALLISLLRHLEGHPVDSFTFWIWLLVKDNNVLMQDFRAWGKSKSDLVRSLIITNLQRFLRVREAVLSVRFSTLNLLASVFLLSTWVFSHGVRAIPRMPFANVYT